MSDNKQAKIDAIRHYDHMIRKVAGHAVRPYRADGYVNLMTKYGTRRDPSENFIYQAEPMIPDELLTEYYESNGLFAKIIDTPSDEAVKHGFQIKDLKDTEIENFVFGALDELGWDELSATAIKWTRLFGGAIAVMLINDGGGLDEPLNWKNIRSIDDIRVFDRSLIQPDYSNMFFHGYESPFESRGSRLGMPEYYDVFSRFGTFRVHDSRCLVFQNGILPENTTNTVYQIWGTPEYIRLKRALQDAEIAHGSAVKLLDRSIQAVYKMKDLSAELATEEGEDRVLRRLQTIDMARGMLNSITIDSEGEDYDFKTFQFTGISDVVDSACNYLSALSSIPQTILFGRSPAGMNATGESDLENYYNYVQAIQKRMLKKNIRYLLSVILQAGLATGEVDEVPDIDIEFNPLWSMSEQEQANIDQQKAATQQTRAQTAQIYVSMEAIDPSEVRKKLADSEEFDVETMLDEYEEEDLFADYPEDHEEETGLEALPEEIKAAMQQQEATEANPVQTQQVQNADSGDVPYLKNELGTGVLVVKDGKILTGIRCAGKCTGQICGPGGHIEAGEYPYDAAMRETTEEFGIVPTDMNFLGIVNSDREGAVGSAVYLVTEWEGDVACDDHEMSDPAFRRIEDIELYKAALFEPFRKSLDLLKAKMSGMNMDNDIDWITVNGTHVPLDNEGNSVGGGKLKGMNFSKATSQKKPNNGSQKTAQAKAPSASTHATPSAPSSSPSNSAPRSAMIKSQNEKLSMALKSSDDENEAWAAWKDEFGKLPVGTSFQMNGNDYTKLVDTDDRDALAYGIGLSDTPTWSEGDVLHMASYGFSDEKYFPTVFDKESKVEKTNQEVESLRESGKIKGSDDVKQTEAGYINSKSPEYGQPGDYVMYRTGDVGSSGMVFFAAQKEGADTYASLHDNKTSQYTISLKNPLVIDGSTDVECIKKAYAALHPGEAMGEVTPSKWKSADKKNASALNKPDCSYDSIIYRVNGEPKEVQISAKRRKDLTKKGTYSTTGWSRTGKDIASAVYEGKFTEDYERLDSRHDGGPGRRKNNDADGDIDWITVNGAHIPLDNSGKAKAGGELKGKDFSKARSEKDEPSGRGGNSKASNPSKGSLNEASISLIQKHKDNPYHFGESEEQKASFSKDLAKALEESGVNVAYNESEGFCPYRAFSPDYTYEECKDMTNALNQTDFGITLSKEEYVKACRDEGQEPRLSEKPVQVHESQLLSKSGKNQSDGTPVYKQLDKEKLMTDDEILKYSGFDRDVNPGGIEKAEKAAKDAVESMSDAERSAINSYTKEHSGAGYRDVNHCLATGEGSPEIKEAAENVTKALDHRIGVDCVTHRGEATLHIGEDSEKANKILAQISNGNFSKAGQLVDMLKGRTVENPVAMSTSPNPLQGYDSMAVQYIFKTPADAKAVDITELSAYGGGRSEAEKKLAATGLFGTATNETEVLYKPGTQYQIDDVNMSLSYDGKKKRGQVFITATVFPDGEQAAGNGSDNSSQTSGGSVSSLMSSVTETPAYKAEDQKRKTAFENMQAADERLHNTPSKLPESEWSEGDRELVSLLGNAYAPHNPEWSKIADESDAYQKELQESNDKLNRMILSEEPPLHLSDFDKPASASSTEFEGFRASDTGTSMDLKGSYVTEMSPKEYLERCAAMFNDTDGRETNLTMQVRGLSRESIDQIKDAIQSGEMMYTPWLDERGINGQEGRHRAAAAYELGIDKIPVVYWSKDGPAEETGEILNEKSQPAKPTAPESQIQAQSLQQTYGNGYAESWTDPDYPDVTIDNLNREEWEEVNKDLLIKNWKDRKAQGIKEDPKEFIEHEWVASKLSKFAGHESEMDEWTADEKLGEHLRQGDVDGWFREANSEYKPRIVDAVLATQDTRNAALSIMWTNYKYNHPDTKMSFKEFLSTPLTMYRGGHGQKHIGSDIFSSYSWDRKVAEKFAGSGGTVYEATVRPVDTYGSIFTTGEAEIMVPSLIAPNSNRDSRADNVGIIPSDFLACLFGINENRYSKKYSLDFMTDSVTIKSRANHADASGDDVEWITTETGAHVPLGSDKKAVGGPMKGKSFTAAKSEKSGKSSTKKGKSGSSSRSTVAAEHKTPSISSAIKSYKVTKFKTEGDTMHVTGDFKVKASKSGKTEVTVKGDITGVYSFAGKGSENNFVNSGNFAKQFPSTKPKDWSHKCGFGTVEDANGKTYTAEIHWFEHDDVGQLGYKIKKR